MDSTYNDLANKLRLRRLLNQSRNREGVIQKNLKPLKENVSKKRMAQTKYYNKCNQGRSPLLKDLDAKLPVQERLGFHTSTKKKVPILGTSTNILMPRKNRRFQRRWNQSSVQNVRNRKFRNSTITQRLGNPNKLSSFKIQVLTGSAGTRSNSSQRFQLTLNPTVQLEIKQIQNSSPRQIFHGLHPIIPVATGIPLNHRFTSLT
ncbi:uncharacterized protein LOC123311166 isoform X1 [Coccinella septempunctata]|uniref:uncharacterized protein LOC123311166 isoform X1 n=1 Tax=Coccinella septempunctata TaxID=41139 RepID=UPI001D06B55E|nr:uncharacterized protein LOC123311166 isoform X1 [Coccinella septempunctata]